MDFERDLIAQALRRTRGNKQAAARLLGVGRTTLLAKLRRTGIEHATHLRAVG